MSVWILETEFAHVVAYGVARPLEHFTRAVKFRDEICAHTSIL
jgi:hypothetical protein